MYTLKPTEGFSRWLDNLPDVTVRGVVTARLLRLKRGLMGDVSPVGGGVSELRIHYGAGWRVYFIQRDPVVIMLLAGGSKRSQAQDIARAKSLAARLI